VTGIGWQRASAYLRACISLIIRDDGHLVYAAKFEDSRHRWLRLENDELLPLAIKSLDGFEDHSHPE
jgi:hypothetical protein